MQFWSVLGPKIPLELGYYKQTFLTTLSNGTYRLTATMVRARCVFPVRCRQACEQQGIVWAAPPAAAQQRLRLPRGRPAAVRVAQRLQRPQPLRKALRQPLRQQAVRLHLARYRGGASRMRRALATTQCSKPRTASWCPRRTAPRRTWAGGADGRPLFLLLGDFRQLPAVLD